MSEVPGSGKSTLDYALSTAIDGMVIGHDILISVLEAGTLFGQSAKQAHRIQWTLAEDLKCNVLGILG
ncbi:hypothetical protein BJ878DRAFT_527851 [Calycina marina]|uniref:Uncharacterized protein n=1 Tax=Calycina marina TaxID=1763456 RepID=A0A9P8CAR9_9HELO|nr:hypothetical protein BJ878DRAFT_527851 [Calycina marina]